MSQCTFIAANVPLGEVHDGYTRTMTLREAVRAGAMSGRAARRAGIDPDEPGVVLTCGLSPGEDPADNFSLVSFPFSREYCGMDYAVSIETGLTRTDEPGLLGAGEMTPEKAERIADYVREVLTRTDAVELWSVWDGCFAAPEITIREVSPADFTGADVREIYSSATCFTGSGFERVTYSCLRVER